MYRIGFIGCGNMAKAILRQMLASGQVNAQDVIATAAHEESRERLQQEFAIQVSDDNAAVASQANIVFLAVKPQVYPGVIHEIRHAVSEETLVITMAPGKSIAWVRELFERDVKIIRTMPNTPAQVGEGMTGVCRDEHISQEEFDTVMELLSCFGKAVEVPESLMDVVGAVSGAAPAFIYMLIEAMADGAVTAGMPRQMAYTFAAQTVMGSARMVLESGQHPGQLKDMVCSPGGTTIEGVRVLEQQGFRSAMIEALQACIDKSRRI